MENGEEKLQQELDVIKEKRILDLQKEVYDLKRIMVGEGTAGNPGVLNTVMEMSKDMYVGPNCLMENAREMKEFKTKVIAYVSGVVAVLMVAEKLVSHLLK